MQTSLNEANYKLCPRWKFYRSCSLMSGTTWQCKDNSTFKASACFDSNFFLVRGRSRSGQSLKIDLFIKKKKNPKKKKTKNQKTFQRRLKKKKNSHKARRKPVLWQNENMANNYDKRNYCYTYLLTNPRPKNKKTKNRQMRTFITFCINKYRCDVLIL